MYRLLVLLACTALTSCGARYSHDCSDQLVSVTIIDRNGFNETISSEDRLAQYQYVDFLSNTPYEKVTRVFGRDQSGNVQAVVTSYHPNGQPRQYLEVLNGRAHGDYKEWHPDGSPKLAAYVIGGLGDIEPGAESSWLFEGISQAWNEDGQLVAEIPYHKGDIEGTAKYYHDNGKIWKRVPYHQGKIEGVAEIFLDDGTLLQTAQYTEGLAHGPTLRYWSPVQVASMEEYRIGLLVSGDYFNRSGQRVGEVRSGQGTRVIFGRNHISETQTMEDGIPNGPVKVFNEQGQLVRKYNIQSGIKRGEEVVYFENSSITQPKMSLNWYGGAIQGTVKTWYKTGTQESQREMTQNRKNGLSTAWYKDGSLMMIEEYEDDKLVKGEYYKKGEKSPISLVQNGEGTATLYDGDGHFIRKVTYRDFQPVK